MSHVTCHISHVVFLIYIFNFFLQIAEASQWRVCYQRSLPRLGFLQFHRSKDIFLEIPIWDRDHYGSNPSPCLSSPVCLFHDSGLIVERLENLDTRAAWRSPASSIGGGSLRGSGARRHKNLFSVSLSFIISFSSPSVSSSPSFFLPNILCLLKLLCLCLRLRLLLYTTGQTPTQRINICSTSLINIFQQVW